MKKIVNKVVLGACLMSLMTACTNNNKNNNKGKINLNPNAYDKSIPANQLAEELALAGEQLMDPIRFMYADLVFSRALNIDPNNKRAQFYKGFVASFMKLRGIYKRVEPAVLKHGDADAIKEYKETVARFPKSGFKTFLLDNSGKADISNESEFQDYLDEYRTGQNDFRKFLKANKEMNLTLHINVLFAGATVDNASEECSVQLTSENYIEYDKKCDLLNALTIKLDKADIEALQHMQAGMQMYTSLVTAYDLNGFSKFISKYDDNTDIYEVPLTPTHKEIVGYFKSNAKAGKLRTNNGLKDIIGMGSDVVAATRWVLKQQKTLCPSGKETRKNRKRNFIKSDVCLSKLTDDNQNINDVLDKMTNYLSGGVMNIEVEKTGRTVSTLMRPAALLLNPVDDLLKLAPDKFDKCGQGTSFSDKTFGGMFPNGDASKVLLKDPQVNCYD
ncbi:MAG: hypothetical protein HOO06_01605 [Bdellovibrionaceae bacterium]|jgi:hypothetical protein|nr:hypothetical protein [Pseudobdellovibrionaceae bacterium]